MTFKTSTHCPGTKSALSNLPHLTEHCLEDEIIEWSTEFQAALQNVVSVLILEQGYCVRSEVLHDQSHLLGTLANVDNLLCRPSTILVNTNLSHVRSDFGQHHISHLI